MNVETLRYYERRGLLPVPERMPSGHRRYDEETVRFLGAIKEAQAVGFTLAEITEYLRAARRSGLPSEVLRVRMAAKIDQIDARIAALQRMRDELARVIGCACASLNHCTCGAAYLARGGGAPTARPSLLHITNGESAGNTLRQTALGGAVLPWQDVLHEGPVPALPRQKLLTERRAAPSRCRRRTHTSRRLRCSAGARGGSLHRRRLVLPSPLRPRTRKGEAAGNRGRHTAFLAASARRQPALRTTPIAANGNRRTNTARRSRSSRTSRHRPLDRRHPHHTRQHLAMGPSRAKARPTLFTLGGLAIVYEGDSALRTGVAARAYIGTRASSHGSGPRWCH